MPGGEGCQGGEFEKGWWWTVDPTHSLRCAMGHLKLKDRAENSWEKTLFILI